MTCGVIFFVNLEMIVKQRDSRVGWWGSLTIKANDRRVYDARSCDQIHIPRPWRVCTHFA